MIRVRKKVSRLTALVRKKVSRLTALSKIHEWSQTGTTPSCPLPMGDVSGRVWPTLITSQQVGIYIKILFGFAACCVSSPTPIYCHIALCVYSPCANVLALHILSVKVSEDSLYLQIQTALVAKSRESTAGQANHTVCVCVCVCVCVHMCIKGIRM